MSTGKAHVLTLRLGDVLYTRISEYAELHGEDLSSATRALISAGLDRLGLRDDLSRAVREVVPQAVAQAVEASSATRDADIKRAVVAATVAVLSKAQGLSAADEAALLQRLLG